MEHYINFIVLYPYGNETKYYSIYNVYSLIEKKKTNFDIGLWFNNYIIKDLVNDYIKYIIDIEANNTESNFYILFETIKKLQNENNIQNKDLYNFILKRRSTKLIEFGNYEFILYFYINYENGKIYIFDWGSLLKDSRIYIFNNFQIFYNILTSYNHEEQIDIYFNKKYPYITLTKENYSWYIKEGILSI